MKRPVLIAVFVIALVFCYCLWGLASQKKSSLSHSDGQSSQTPRPESAPTPVLPQVPATAPSQAASLHPVTDDFKRVMDSPDVMKTVSEIRLHGSQDQKDWASAMAASCRQVIGRSHQLASESSSQAEAEPKASKAVEAEKARALATLQERCKGIGQMNTDDYWTLRQELAAGNATSQSVLGRLHQLVSSQDDRWTDDTMKMVTEGIYSSDPVVQRNAFFALQGAIDLNASGGPDRKAAMQVAFSDEAYGAPLSEFERLSNCYLSDNCEANVNEWLTQPTTNPQVERLVKDYKSAVRSHADARTLLAIK